MIISFANQKGGVGKSTLCLSLANYWASQGMPVHIVETDRQRSLSNIRKAELENYPLRKPLFEIELVLFEDFAAQVEGRRDSADHLMVDLPGRCDSAVLEIIKYSDVVIVPFQYEETVLDSTSMFARYLDLVDSRLGFIKRKIIYVPNAVDFKIGNKADKEYWDSWKAGIEEVALLAPPIPLRVCMRRRSSMFLKPDERDCVSSCFEYITDIVFENQLTKEKDNNR